MSRCAHPDCTVEISGHQLACPPHWYQLPTPLRNRIVRYHNRGQHTAHARAVADALLEWAGPRAPSRGLRCHRCKTPTDFIDVALAKPACITCVRSQLGDQDATFTCSRCHAATPVLVGVDTQPALCLDCQYYDTLHLESSSL